MITIILIIEAIVILLFSWFRIIKSVVIVFLVVAIITGVLAFILKDRLNCPFAKRCPFVICPLNKLKR